MLAGVALECEIRRHQSHDQRTGNINEQGRIRKSAAKGPADQNIDPVPERGAEAAA
jgi:hypothetical protein